MRALTLTRPSRRELRLGSGLVLFAYVAAHLVNHALGLISIAAAERGLAVAVALWHSVPGTVLLYGAAAIHISLALLAIYEHRTLRMPPRELLRIALGLGMPVLLIGHAVSTRLAYAMYAHPPDYAHTVWSLWNSGRQGLQLALLVPGWLHGCLGLNFAFGRRPWFRRARLPLFAAALLVPTFAVLGFLAMVKEVSMRARDPAWIATTIGRIDEAQRASLTAIRDDAVMFWLAVIAAILVARLMRRAIEERRGALVSIRYPGRTVRVPRGWTVLEASRSHRIAHVSMCGGQARCSTCRVRVLDGADHCPPAEAAERETLARIGAATDTRLGCQLRPNGDVSVVPLLTTVPGGRTGSGAGAEERDAAILLVDFRCERPGRRLLSHDLLYALDRFGEAFAAEAGRAGGRTIQFTGDRGVAVFGTDVVASEARRQALSAATALDGRLALLHADLRRSLGCASSHVVVVHAGATAIGAIGDRSLRTLAAAGATIETVRRIAAGLEREGADGVFVTREAVVETVAGVDVAQWREGARSAEGPTDVGRVVAPSTAA